MGTWKLHGLKTGVRLGGVPISRPVCSGICPWAFVELEGRGETFGKNSGFRWHNVKKLMFVVTGEWRSARRCYVESFLYACSGKPRCHSRAPGGVSRRSPFRGRP